MKNYTDLKNEFLKLITFARLRDLIECDVKQELFNHPWPSHLLHSGVLVIESSS